MRFQLAATCAVLSAVSSIHAETLVGLTTNNQLVRFDSMMPAMTSMLPITGVPSGHMILAIDQRPVGLQLYGIGSDTVIYTIDLNSGAATPVGPAASPMIATSDLGIDFNPSVDRIRLVDANGNNRRFVPTTGASAGVDMNLSYVGGGVPRAVGIAYTNSQAGGVPAGTVREYIIDSNNDSLAEVGSLAGGNPSFNAGVTTLVGSLGVSTTDEVGFDISGFTGMAYASLTNANNISSLYTIDLTSGQATLVGMIGTDMQGPISDLAVIPEPTTLALGAGIAAMALRRRSR